MARIIPSDFDVNKEALDLNEIFIRDVLKVKIDYWAKFRFSIHVGNSSGVLSSSTPLDNDVKQAFIELAKSHYEVVNSIGYARLCLCDLKSINKDNPDYFFKIHKGLKEFYIHLGSVFDNFARLIFIINHPNSASEVMTKKKKLVRHWIDWPQLARDYRYDNYISFIENPILKEILTLRNNFIHNWRPAIKIINQELYLSNGIRLDRNFLWPYEEKCDFIKKYSDYKPLLSFVEDDFSYTESIQNEIFKLLINDLSVFETNYNLKIKE